MVVSWPKGIKAKGELRHQYMHATDVVPTIYDCLGVELPGRGQGLHADTARRAQLPLLRFETPTRRPRRRPASSRCSAHGRSGTRAGRPSASIPPSPAGATSGRTWELYHTTSGPDRVHDLADQHPEKLQELVELWFLAGRHIQWPAARGPHAGRGPDHRPAHSWHSHATGTSTTRRAEVPEPRGEHAQPLVHIAAEVDIETPEAGGVLFSHGRDSAATPCTSRTACSSTSTTSSAS